MKEQVDHVQSETEVDTVVNMGGQDFPTPGTSKVGNSGMNKPPQLPAFSGTDPVPKDEVSYEQWEFQVRGAMGTYTEESVKSALINSVRGEARKLVSFVGFEAGLSDILTKIKEQFSHIVNPDHLHHEFSTDEQ